MAFESDKCYTFTEGGNTYFIPVCWSAVIRGDEFCTCFDGPDGPATVEDLQREIRRTLENIAGLRMRVTELRRELKEAKRAGRHSPRPICYDDF